MIIGKKHLVLAALIIALGAAVYLNWQFTPTDTILTDAAKESETENVADVQVEYVAAISPASATDASVGFGEEAVEAGRKTSFFDDARSDREKTRNEALATVRELIDDASLDSSQKTDAVNSAAKIAECMDKEASIETLIKAKGYSECVVVIGDTQINVIIPAKENGITPADAAIIKDIVVGQVNIAPSCIKIIEAK